MGESGRQVGDKDWWEPGCTMGGHRVAGAMGDRQLMGWSLGPDMRVWAEALRVRGLRARAAPESSQACPRPWCPTGHYSSTTDAPARRCHQNFLPHQLHVHPSPSIQQAPGKAAPALLLLPSARPGHASGVGVGRWAGPGAAPLLRSRHRILQAGRAAGSGEGWPGLRKGTAEAERMLVPSASAQHPLGGRSPPSGLSAAQQHAQEC